MKAITNVFVRESYPAVASGATVLYAATLVDQDQQPVPGSALSTLTLSVVDTGTGAIVNSVDDTDVLNTDRGTVDEAGNLRVTLTSADTLLGVEVARGVRSIVLKWSWDSGSKTGRHQVDFKIQALAD